MNQKPLYLAGICCMAAGILSALVGISAGALNHQRYASKLNLTDQTDTIAQSFDSLSVDVALGDVCIQSGETATVTGENVPAETYQVFVKNGTLQVKLSQKGKWYNNIQLGSITDTATKITITLPQQLYQTIILSVDTGTCDISDIQGGQLSLTADCGNCTLQALTLDNCQVINNLGELHLTDSTISGNAVLEADCGDIIVQQTDIQGECNITNDLGDVTLTDTTYGSSRMELDCGDLKLERCTDTTTTGSSFLVDMGNVTLNNCELYRVEATLDMGSLDTKSTALRGYNTISVEMGDISLGLKGSAADYGILSLLDGTSPTESTEKAILVIDAEDADVKVTYTEQ